MQISIGISVKGARTSGSAPVNIVAPGISGTTSLGSVLTSTYGGWNDAISYSFQWKRGATNIGTNTTTYTLVAADSGAAITCVVTATNASGSTPATSNTITAQTYSAPANTIAPVISGTTTLGSTLSSTTGAFNGNPSPTYGYQWRRNAVNIPSATGSTYVLVSADSGAAITCVVTATNALGSSSATSNTITADTYAAPVNSSPPSISGTTTIGSVLTSTFGGWLNSPTSYAFQWNRNGSPIPSATTSSYTLVQADSASAITCVVTATNAFGSTPSTSNTLTTPTYSAAFTSTWAVTAGETITLPYEAGGTYSGTIDWGDSSTSTNSYANRTHTYATAGTYTISITGVTTGFRFANTGSRLNIRTITNWGTLRLGNSTAYFQGCSNLTLTTVAGTLDLTGTTDFFQFFGSCGQLTTINGINSWSTGAVTNMYQMFYACTNFNQELSFNTAAVTIMTGMFQFCSSFNSSLTFNTALVNSMNFMFFQASQFNTAPTFSSTAAVTTMQSMFRDCSSFNKALSLNTGAVTTMYQMFSGATAFNQDISGWNTISVTSMGNMFNGATAFNQNLGSWNVANVTDFVGFMSTKTPATFSAANLDAIYNGWVTVGSSLNISFGTAKYTAAGTAGRAYLTGTKLWTITDGGEDAAAFTSTWLVTAGETITLPYEAAGTYSGTIDWGDSTTSVNSYANRTHTYSTAGTKTISITGVTTGFRFAFTASILNIRTITNWGTLRLGNNNGYFQGCANLTLTTVVGTLDLTGTTNFGNMFNGCSSLTTVNGINSWSTGAVTSMPSMFSGATAFNQALSFNTAAVTNMSQMFSGATAFNQNLGSWNVANVQDFTGFMANKTPATFSTTNLDAIYNGWVTVLNSKTISFGTAKYSAAGAAGRAYLTGTKLWTITDGGEDANAFTSTWLVTAGETITLPYEAAGTYLGTIDWGDSTTSVNSYANRTHTYATAGTKTISITGVTTGFTFNNTGSKLNIRTITNWGTLRLSNSGFTFFGCTNLTLTAVTGVLDLTGATNLNGMFWNCTALTIINGINTWNFASVVSMNAMFNNCSNWNQPLVLNTGAVNDMGFMFNNCINYNNTCSLNTASVLNMSQMFSGCTIFNQPLNFTTGAVTNMFAMFRQCTAFNSTLTFSSTASVLTMSQMFGSCTNFNQPLTFNTASVTNMSSMFDGATAFQQFLGSWNVANVTNFTSFMAAKIGGTFPANYLDDIYNGWSVQSVKPNINISFGLAQYTSAGAAGKFSLQNVNNWTITDGGEGV